MQSLKGFTQLTSSNDNEHVANYESHYVWGWYTAIIENGSFLFLKTPMSGIELSGWENENIPGRNHKAFTNFVLWFEYE